MTTPNHEAELIPLDPLELLKRDPIVAEKAWNRLSLDEQTRYVLAAPLEMRQALCDLSHQAQALVQALPPQEVWLTIQTAGGADALALFQHTSVEQVQFCLDVECWGKDRWLSAPTFEWLRVIVACGEAKMIEFFESIDEQLLGLLMKRWVNVYVREQDEDVFDAIPWPRKDPPVTLDGAIYFQVEDAEIDQWLRPMLETYWKHDPDGLRHLLLSLLGLSPSEQEEIAYQIRSRRLAEEGFPEWEEAMGAYRRVPLDDLSTLPRRPARATRTDDLPHLAFALIPIRDTTLLLKEALAQLDPALREAIGVELARLANRILIADGHAISLDHTRHSLQKVIGYVNVGLEQASGQDVARAATLLEAYWLTGLFQLGFSRLMRLAEASRGWMAKHPASDDDDPSSERAIAVERIRAASWKWPKYYVGPYAPDGILHRDFQTLEEVSTVECAMRLPRSPAADSQ